MTWINTISILLGVVVGFSLTFIKDYIHERKEARCAIRLIKSEIYMHIKGFSNFMDSVLSLKKQYQANELSEIDFGDESKEALLYALNNTEKPFMIMSYSWQDTKLLACRLLKTSDIDRINSHYDKGFSLQGDYYKSIENYRKSNVNKHDQFYAEFQSMYYDSAIGFIDKIIAFLDNANKLIAYLEKMDR